MLGSPAICGGSTMKAKIGVPTALLVLVTLTALTDARAAGGKIVVEAAENFYGDVAQQIGGDQVSVTSIISNPDQDPHLFETSPSVVRQIAAAQVVIYNGADYDPWMDRLLTVATKSGRVAIVAADLMHKKSGDNPHLWYDPATMPAVAKALAAAFSATDPAHASSYKTRLESFLASLRPINDKIAAIRAKYSGVPVTASEPVFGYMAAALHLTMLNQPFQLAIMNNTEPSARDVAGFERDLKTHKVRVLFYNKQASDKIVQHLVALASASKIPVVGVTETCPPGLSYQDWMLSEADATAKALAGPSS
jgi:zinc/manganese transport system substrate-binding protein